MRVRIRDRPSKMRIQKGTMTRMSTQINTSRRRGVTFYAFRIRNTSEIRQKYVRNISDKLELGLRVRGLGCGG
jgi:hypothetical protein